MFFFFYWYWYKKLITVYGYIRHCVCTGAHFNNQVRYVPCLMYFPIENTKNVVFLSSDKTDYKIHNWFNDRK